MIRPPRPGMRIFSPDRSPTEPISVLNHPPIWQPVLPAGNWMASKRSAYMPCSSSRAPPSYSQAFCWRALRPNGRDVPNAVSSARPV